MILNENFTMVPNSIIRNPKITNAEFRIYVTFSSYGYGDNDSFVSQKLVANVLGITTRAIRYSLKSLKNKCYIGYKRRGFNKSNVYSFPTDRKDISSDSGKQLPHNNTNNKTSNNYINEEETRKGLQHISELMGWNKHK